STNGANNNLTKVGGGNLILSGPNTYGGTTEIQQGILVVHNPMALGSPLAGTTVDSGAALELQSSLNLEPITVNGDGVPFLHNSHNTGALRNLSGNNTYTGTLTLATSTTIGVDSGSSLTIAGNGSVVGASTASLTKELPGTLVLASANSYGGL